MSATKKIYAAADFGRYHRGEMSAAEMHAMEKAALHDPFVADALEGYAFTNAPEADIAELEQRLANMPAPVISLERSKNLWWKIAAVAIIMVGVGYFVYTFSTAKNEQMLAENKMATRANLDTIVQGDAAIARDDLAFTTGDTIRSQAVQMSPKPRDEMEKTEIKKLEEEARQKNRALNQRSIAAKESAKKTAPENMPYTLQGKVINEEGMFLADASVKNKEDMLVTKTDKEGNYTLKASEAQVQSEIQVAGYGTVNKKLEANQANVVVVSADKYNYNNNASMPNNAIKSSTQRAKLKNILIPVATPIGGLAMYKNYLKNNITPEMDDNGLQYIGNVKLGFELNGEGRPQNIKVLQSLCDRCDIQAINLLKNGVPWTGTTGKNYELDVTF